jgi:hypothetical protein
MNKLLTHMMSAGMVSDKILPLLQKGGGSRSVLPAGFGQMAPSASESTSFLRPMPGNKKASTATTGMTPQEQKAATEALRRQTEYDRLERERRIAERQAAAETRRNNTPFTLPSGERKTYDEMSRNEQLYVAGKNLGNLQNENWTDYINPLAMLGSMSEGLGTAPYAHEQTGSVMPYITGFGAPLAAGALGGLGARSTGQFLQNTMLPVTTRQVGNLYHNVQDYLTRPRSINQLSEKNIFKQLGTNLQHNDGSFNEGVFPLKNFPNHIVKLEFPESVGKSMRFDQYKDFDFVKAMQGLPRDMSVARVQKQIDLQNGLRALVMNKVDGLKPRDIAPINFRRMPDQAIVSFYNDLKRLRDNDLGFDFYGHNYMYDPAQQQFKLFDISPQFTPKGDDFWVKDVLGGGNQNLYGKQAAGENLKAALKSRLISDHGQSIYKNFEDMVQDGFSGRSAQDLYEFSRKSGEKLSQRLDKILSGLDPYQGGGPIVDPRGQWAHPGKVTRIPSSTITMQGVPYPVMGVASNGQQKLMMPGQNYRFKGAKYVDEYPIELNMPSAVENEAYFDSHAEVIPTGERQAPFTITGGFHGYRPTGKTSGLDYGAYMGYGNAGANLGYKNKRGDYFSFGADTNGGMNAGVKIRFQNGGALPQYQKRGQVQRATTADSLSLYNNALQLEQFYDKLTPYYEKIKTTPWDKYIQEDIESGRVQRNTLKHPDVTEENKNLIRSNKDPNVHYLSDVITGAIDPAAPLLRYDSRIKPQGVKDYRVKPRAKPGNLVLSEAIKYLESRGISHSKNSKHASAVFDILSQNLRGLDEVQDQLSPILKKYKVDYDEFKNFTDALYQKDREELKKEYPHTPGVNTQIPYYAPLAVKPYHLLTEEEKIIREQMYGEEPAQNKVLPAAQNFSNPQRQRVREVPLSSTQRPSFGFPQATPSRMNITERPAVPTPFAHTFENPGYLQQQTRYFPNFEQWNDFTEVAGYNSRSYSGDKSRATSSGYRRQHGGELPQMQWGGPWMRTASGILSYLQNRDVPTLPKRTAAPRPTVKPVTPSTNLKEHKGLTFQPRPIQSAPDNTVVSRPQSLPMKTPAPTPFYTNRPGLVFSPTQYPMTRESTGVHRPAGFGTKEFLPAPVVDSPNVLEQVEGWWNGLTRGIQKNQEQDQESILKVQIPKADTLRRGTADTVKNNIQYGYQQLGVVPDVKGAPGDSLVSFVNVFDNDEGGLYQVGHKVVEPGRKDFKNALGVAHFIMDGDILPNQQYTGPYQDVRGHTIGSNVPGKFINFSGSGNPNEWLTGYRQDGDDYRVIYRQRKDITEAEKKKYSFDLAVRNHAFSDINWDAEGKKTGFAAHLGKTRNVPLADGRSTSIPYKHKDAFDRFSGGSVIFSWTDPATGKKVAADFAGSVNSIRQMGQSFLKQYNLKPQDMQVLYHDMGSYSAKPKAKMDGNLFYKQWLNYNNYNRGRSGAPLVIPSSVPRLNN